MPVSADEGKAEATGWLRELAPLPYVVDVGAGAGTWGRIVRQVDRDSYITAIEVWEPYVHEFGLHDVYDVVWVGNALVFPWLPCSLVILGDVVEHLGRGPGTELVGQAMDHADWVLMSLPIVPWPQGSVNGNHYEAHVADWTDDQVRSTFGEPARAAIGPNIGVYLWET